MFFYDFNTYYFWGSLQDALLGVVGAQTLIHGATPTTGKTNSKKATYVEERFNPETLKAEQIVTESSRNNGLSYSGMGLDNTSSTLNLSFYF